MLRHVRRSTFFVLILQLLAISIVNAQSCDATIPEAKCLDATCGIEIAALSSLSNDSPCNCTTNDYGTAFTNCVNGQRSLYYFYKPPAICLNGALPPPVSGISCDLSCKAGTFFNSETKACEDCSKGFYSYGTGQRWHLWKQLPSQFSTSCVINQQTKCEGWSLLGDVVESGNNKKNDNLLSAFEFNGHFVRNGSVTFEYKVSAEERYDGLRFLVDGVSLLTAHNTDWKRFNANIPEGFHSLQWVYFKDRSITRGEDKASLRTISVDGLTFAQTQCSPCPLGYASNSTAAEQCTPCPAGKFTNQLNSTECQDCPPGYRSFPASSGCVPERVCSVAKNSTDYTWHHTSCENGRRSVIYEWVYPLNCDSDGINLPPMTSEDCVPEDCHPGQFKDSSTGECVYCPNGSSSDGKSDSCTPCKSGSRAGHMIRHVDDWTYPLPSGFSTSCSGEDCFGKWRSGRWYADSGLGHGSEAVSSLIYTVNATKEGHLSFNFTMECESPNELRLYVDDNIINTFLCGSCLPNWNVYELPFESDENNDEPINNSIYGKIYTVKWSYIKRTDAVNGSCDRVVFTNMTVHGVLDGPGGSGQCEDCPAGTFSEKDSATSCTPCAPGTTSSPKSTTCESCEEGSFNDLFGASHCIPCGSGTHVSNDHRYCEYNCDSLSFSDNTTGRTRQYDLSNVHNFTFTYSDNYENVSTTFTFVGNHCSWIACNSTSEQHAYVCQRIDGSSTDTNFGKVLDISEMNSTVGLNFDFSHGDSVNVSNKTSVFCSARLQLKCDITSTEDSNGVEIENPSEFRSNLRDLCHLSLIYRTKYACPLCTNEDFAALEGTCVDGKMERTYTKVNPYCYGGVPLPSSEQVACETSQKSTSGAITFLVVMLIIICVAAVSGIALLYYKHRKLYATYSKLRNNVPMDEDDHFDNFNGQ